MVRDYIGISILYIESSYSKEKYVHWKLDIADYVYWNIAVVFPYE